MSVPLPLAQAAASLIAPGLAVAGALAVAVPITLHLLSRRRRRERPWAAMRFLREAIEKQRRRLRFERWLLLACRCLALLLLGLALAGPLVGGGIARALGVAGAAGRSVDLVIDNGIASGAEDPDGGPTPLEVAKERAAALLATLGPEDRVRVWLIAGPGLSDDAENPPAVPPAEAAEAVAAIGLTDAGPDWERVRTGVAAAAEADVEAGREAAVVILSPLFEGDETLTAGRGPSAKTSETSDGPRVLLSPPAAGRANLQVVSVRPGRALVAVGEGGAGVAGPGRLEAVVRVRRAGSGGEGGPAEARVRVRAVQRPSGEAGGRRTLTELDRWPALAEGAASVPLAPASGADAAEAVEVRVPLALTRRGRRGEVLLVATLEPGGAVAADDAAVAALAVVERVRVGLLGGAGGAGTLGPADFFAAALGEAERKTGPEPLREQTFSVSRLGSAWDLGERPDVPDAVIALDPAAVGPAGREAIAAFVVGGGALWLTPSADAPPDEPGAGLDPLFAGLGLPWRAAGGVDSDEAPRADAGTPPPPALALLSGQWESLLRPLRFERAARLEGVDPVDAWMRLGGGEVVLASASSGAGRVVVLAAAADPAWTNLPAKPLFPALVRDGLLAALAERSRVPVVAASPRGGEERAAVDESRTPTRIIAPDVEAADTTSLPAARAAAAFASIGEVSFLGDDVDARVFDDGAARASLAGGLLWLVLTLLVLEAVAGRAFTRS